MGEPTESPNSLQADLERVEAGRITWFRVLAFTPARTVFLLCALTFVALAYYLRNVRHPWRSSTAWWTVYGTLADLACLALLIGLTRHEGLRLPDLLKSGGFQPLPKILGKGLLYFAVTMPLFLGGFVLSSLITYSSLWPHFDAALVGARQLPTWAALYSVTVWWTIWSATEELTYQAYLLQRFQALSGRLTPGLLIVGF